MFNIKHILLFIFTVSTTVFLAHFAIVGDGVWGDGRYYYSYVRSWVIDRDLDFANEAEHFSYSQETTSTGRIANKFSIGPAILWLPFFLTAHILVNLASFIHPAVNPNGYSAAYQVSTGIGSITYAVLGLLLAYRIAIGYLPHRIALLSLTGVFFASNLFYYTAVDPINSHAVSFFLASAVLYFLLTGNSDEYTSILLGLGGGLLAAVRLQDIIFSLLVFIYQTLGVIRRKLRVSKLVLFLLGFAVAFLPQVITWKLLYGKIESPYLIAGETLNWFRPRVLSVLFDYDNGLFITTPVLLFATFGLIILAKRERAIGGIVLSLLIAQFYVTASWHAWEGGAAYGARFFVSIMPVFIIGAGSFLDWLKRNGVKTLYSGFALIALGVLNGISIVQFLLNN